MKYDIKYRRRAIEYWGEGHSKKETAEVFKVDPLHVTQVEIAVERNRQVRSQKGYPTMEKD